jgi:hypothetical protein
MTGGDSGGSGGDVVVDVAVGLLVVVVVVAVVVGRCSPRPDFPLGGPSAWVCCEGRQHEGPGARPRGAHVLLVMMMEPVVH